MKRGVARTLRQLVACSVEFETVASRTRPGAMAEGTASAGRKPRALLALVRAALEGEEAESLAESLAKFRVEEGAVDADGDDAANEEVATRRVGLGPEGRVQATGLGMEIAVVLAGYASTTARVFHAPDSPSCAETAATVAAQLGDGAMSPSQRVPCEVTPEPALASPPDGDHLLSGASIKSHALDARPAPGGVVVLVTADPAVLSATAEAMGLDGLAKDAFEHARGALMEYPEEGTDKWELRRELSHE